MKKFTLEELKDEIQPLGFFGETLFEIHKQTNGQTEIHILDEEQERFIDTMGDIVEGEYRKIFKFATLYTDMNGVVTLVEPSYKELTTGNIKQTQLLLSLVGTTISIK